MLIFIFVIKDFLFYFSESLKFLKKSQYMFYDLILNSVKVFQIQKFLPLTFLYIIINLLRYYIIQVLFHFNLPLCVFSIIQYSIFLLFLHNMALFMIMSFYIIIKHQYYRFSSLHFLVLKLNHHLSSINLLQRFSFLFQT